MQKYSGKVSFVSIVGDSKTGKSFLMNNLIGLDHNHFESESSKLNHSSSAISSWIWSIPLYIPQNDKFIFFIDTKGLEKIDFPNDAGQKIFTIITLLSSCLLYNMIGDLTESTLRKLFLVATLPVSVTSSYSFHNEENNEDKIEKINHFFPKFVFVLRDIEKETKDLKIKEKIIKTSARENMENILNDFSKTRNELTLKIKKTLVALFKNRDCITFPKPFKESLAYQQESINQEFFNSIVNLREKIEKELDSKSMFNQELNSRMICHLVQFFVDISNQNGVLDLSLW